MPILLYFQGMKPLLLASLLLMALCAQGQTEAPMPHASKGRLVLMEEFPSRYVAARSVDVWLPEGYSSARKYAVLYMHDGGALFDSTASWNRQEWGVDETMARLQAEGKIQDCIVVGIYNTGATRHAEYWPQKPFEAMTKPQQTQVLASGKGKVMAKRPFSDAYLKFLVEELKPYIDGHYSTYTDKAHTFIAGSSMGGLISWYALCEYPQVYGGAACLSTHWTGVFGPNEFAPKSFARYLGRQLPNPATHKLYMDYGNQTLDSLYPKHQRLVNKVLKARGYVPPYAVVRYFPGADHSERAWSKRLEEPLLFLLAKP